MKIAIVGSRGYTDLEFVNDYVMNLFHSSKIDMYPKNHEFISGGSSAKDQQGNETSVDKYAENVIDNLNRIYKNIYNTPIKKQIFKPDWNKYGKSAGFRRNQLIVNEADKVIAFWDGKSKGTKHSIDLAIKANKPLDIYIRS